MCLVTQDLPENIFVTSTVCSCRVTSCKEIGFKDRRRTEIFRDFSPGFHTFCTFRGHSKTGRGRVLVEDCGYRCSLVLSPAAFLLSTKLSVFAYLKQNNHFIHSYHISSVLSHCFHFLSSSEERRCSGTKMGETVKCENVESVCRGLLLHPGGRQSHLSQAFVVKIIRINFTIISAA